jgi:hypothetical protein
MSLPLVLDIALGLIFIYLILSLLASEIQELIATLLQWRAEHLKRSIEILLSGNIESDPTQQRVAEAQQFADELYRSPLVKALNQEAKGQIALVFRHLNHSLGDLYRTITRTRNVFGNQRSGPSYMPSETFAVALLQKLDIEFLSQKLSEQTMSEFVEDKLALVESILESLRNSIGDDVLLESEFDGLKRSLNQIATDFIQRRVTLSASFDRAIDQLGRFIDNTETALVEDDHCKEIIRRRLPYLKQAIVLRKLEPTIAEAISFILDPKNRASLSPQLAQIVDSISQGSSGLPQELKLNLVALAKQAQTKVDSLDQGVLQLQKEVEDWFNRSMERASGVYRRNSKGIAILIGIAIAAATNADTFHIVSRLSKDSILRASISQAAEQVVTQTTQSAVSPTFAPTPPETEANPDTAAPAIDPTLDSQALSPQTAELQTSLQSVRDAVNITLEGLPIPIGWDEVNREQQQLEGAAWRVPMLRQILGWFVTGVALSMGANFWYQLLSKVIRVRNTGTAKGSSSET